MTDKELLRIAIDEAEKCEGPKYGAVVAKGGEIVATNYSRVYERNAASAHAEVSAIRSACEMLKTPHLEGCTLYASAEPCFMCFDCAAWAHIERVVYAISRKDADEDGYHTNEFDIHDLNKHYRDQLKIEQVTME